MVRVLKIRNFNNIIREDAENCSPQIPLIYHDYKHSSTLQDLVKLSFV